MILDTCAILWLANDQSKFSKEVLSEIEEIPVIYVSAISGFEIALKYNSGKLILPETPSKWFLQIVENHNLSVIDLSSEICIKSALLPNIHKDPCDRFIIATSIIHNLRVVTADENYKKYGVNVVL